MEEEDEEEGGARWKSTVWFRREKKISGGGGGGGKEIENGELVEDQINCKERNKANFYILLSVISKWAYHWSLAHIMLSSLSFGQIYHHLHPQNTLSRPQKNLLSKKFKSKNPKRNILVPSKFFLYNCSRFSMQSEGVIWFKIQKKKIRVGG